MRPQNHGRTASQGLDQILPAQGFKAAAHQRQMRQAVIKRHLAQRIAEPEAAILQRRCITCIGRMTPLAASGDAEPGIGNQLSHRIKALGMARHDQPLHGAGQIRLLLQLLQQQQLFAFAATGKQNDGLLLRQPQSMPPICRPAHQLLVRLCIELEIAQHRADFGPHIAQTARIVFGLRPDGGQCPIGWL